jgi:hypothetical protein
MNITSIENKPGDPITVIYHLDSTIESGHLTVFLTGGYTTSDAFTSIGIFYVCKDGLVSNTDFGNDWLYMTTESDELRAEFEEILNSL